MKPEEFKTEWQMKPGTVVLKNGKTFTGQVFKTNPADNEEDEGDTVFIQIWQADQIIEGPLEEVKEIRF